MFNTALVLLIQVRLSFFQKNPLFLQKKCRHLNKWTVYILCVCVCVCVCVSVCVHLHTLQVSSMILVQNVTLLLKFQIGFQNLQMFRVVFHKIHVESSQWLKGFRFDSRGQLGELSVVILWLMPKRLWTG